jgi:hypothetical protein
MGIFSAFCFHYWHNWDIFVLIYLWNRLNSFILSKYKAHEAHEGHDRYDLAHQGLDNLMLIHPITCPRPCKAVPFSRELIQVLLFQMQCKY